MPMNRTLLLALLLAALAAGGAHAASSDWHHVEGGSIRIVTSGPPDEDGLLYGALEIRLKPGWKTYWLDPGDAGVPPTLDVVGGDGAATVEIGFPQPQRFDDGYSVWAGYGHPVALALTFALPSADTPARIEASAFLGVCETICIPVQADLVFDPQAGVDDPEHAVIVASAFAALPGPARPGFGAHATAADEDAILVEADLPDGVRALDLFVAGTETLGLGKPELVDGGARPAFRVPVTGRYGDADGELAYTLVTTAGAVAGRLTLP